MRRRDLGRLSRSRRRHERVDAGADVCLSPAQHDTERMSKRMCTTRIQLCAATCRVLGKSADDDFEQLDRTCIEAGRSGVEGNWSDRFAVWSIFEDRSRRGRAGVPRRHAGREDWQPALNQRLVVQEMQMMQGGKTLDALRILEIASYRAHTVRASGGFGSHPWLRCRSRSVAHADIAPRNRRWRRDFDGKPLPLAKPGESTAYAASLLFNYGFTCTNGALHPGCEIRRGNARAVEFARRKSGTSPYARLPHAWFWHSSTATLRNARRWFEMPQRLSLNLVRSACPGKRSVRSTEFRK